MQSLPGFGGFPINSLLPNIEGGVLCTVGHPDKSAEDFAEACASGRPAILLVLYNAMNFGYNILGLLLTRHGSASLAAVAYVFFRLP